MGIVEGMKKNKRKLPYGIYHKGVFMLVAGAESARMAAAIHEQLEYVHSIRVSV